MDKKDKQRSHENATILGDWSLEERELIQQTVARDANPEELALFLYTARARGLDPLLKQIYFIKRKQKRGDRWIETGTIQTGIDGFRIIANRTNAFRGIERGIRRDEQGKLYAWAKVWRKDWEQPVLEEVALDEYRGDSPLWSRMPEQMLKKCAEALALRMAFPEVLSGLYSHEEMDQADQSPGTSAAIPSEILDIQVDRFKATQQAMKDCAKAIKNLQSEYNLTKEEIQWATGLETLKKADLETLEKALNDLIQYCDSKALKSASI